MYQDPLRGRGGPPLHGHGSPVPPVGWGGGGQWSYCKFLIWVLDSYILSVPCGCEGGLCQSSLLARRNNGVYHMHATLHHNVAPDCTALLQRPTLQRQARGPAAFPLISLKKFRNLAA